MYSNSRTGLNKYEALFVIGGGIAGKAYNPPGDLANFPKTLKKIKHVFTFFDCDGS